MDWPNNRCNIKSCSHTAFFSTRRKKGTICDCNDTSSIWYKLYILQGSEARDCGHGQTRKILAAVDMQRLPNRNINL
eukprot:1254511-Pleurochrysis_carterae.AAC.1